MRYPNPTPPAGRGCGSPGPRGGGHSGRDTPGPSFPNPEAKTASADGTAPARVWESRTPPPTPQEKGGPPSGPPSCLPPPFLRRPRTHGTTDNHPPPPPAARHGRQPPHRQTPRQTTNTHTDAVVVYKTCVNPILHACYRHSQHCELRSRGAADIDFRLDVGHCRHISGLSDQTAKAGLFLPGRDRLLHGERHGPGCRSGPGRRHVRSGPRASSQRRLPRLLRQRRCVGRLAS